MQHKWTLLAALLLAPLNLSTASAVENDRSPLPPVSTNTTTVGADSSLKTMQDDFLKLKFGMFLHFNLETYKGVQWLEGYHDPSTFNPGVETIDTDAWADAAKAAGMKYGVLTVKHTAGFCLWDSQYTTYDVMNPKCPYKKDLVAQFIKSFKSRGLKAGLYYGWRHPKFGSPDKYKLLPPECDPATHTVAEQFEFQKKQIAELLAKYPDVFYVWNDAFDPAVAPAADLLPYLRAVRPDILACANGWDSKDKGRLYADIAVTERAHFPVGNTLPGETCWTLEQSWFWNKGFSPKAAQDIVAQVRIANSRHANFLLNVAPDRQGKLGAASVKTLAEIGELLRAPAPPNSTVTLDSLLKEMIDREAVARWPVPAYVSHQASSYDRHSKAPDKPGWFANSDHDQFIRSEKHGDRTEWVMMDAEGPGCVTRFWIGGKPATGTVRFYLDGAAEPAIQGQLQDLLCGRSFIHKPLADEHPKEAGNSWLPIPYARQCKVTYDEIDPKHPGWPPPLRWYNIEYRAYPDGTAVKSFSMADYQAAQSALEAVQSALAGGATPVGDIPAKCVIDQVIGPGGQAAVDLPNGSAAVRRLEFRLENPDAQALRSLVLKAEFDGETTIWCPVGDFFGSGVGVNVLESWTRMVAKDGVMTCRWVMPYKTSARVSLLNHGQQKVSVKLGVTAGPWAWDDRSMHFHANWRQQDGIPTRPHSDWNYITVSGRGVYVGDVLSVFNPQKKWFGEGDEKIWVDGESFPSHFGTGTEDYYCSAWGFPALAQGSFANVVRSDDPVSLSHTVVTRTRSLDAIPFTKSLQFDMEVQHWGDCKVAYAATTYWYAVPGATCNRVPQPEEAARPVHEKILASYFENAVECEKMKVVAKSPGLPAVAFPHGGLAGDWSGNAELLVYGRTVGDFIELNFPAKGKSKLELHLTKSVDCPILRFSVNGQKTGEDYDAWSAKPVVSGPISLGVFDPKDGGFVLRAELVGANPNAVRTKALIGLDCVVVTPQ